LNTDEIFSYDWYVKFLKKMKEKSNIIRMMDWRNSPLDIILRHDVDLDLLFAYKLSRVEKANSVTATYFILTTSEAYNPRTKKNRSLLLEMIIDGFEIGLHFDPTVFGEVNDVDLIKHFNQEIESLENIINRPVQSVSLHNPSVHGKYPLFNGYINAYDPDLFGDQDYLSDSCLSFRGKDPFEFIELKHKKTCQILLHPLHYGEIQRGYDIILDDYIQMKAKEIDEEYKVNRAYVKKGQRMQFLLSQ
jgi:hypothetical protein